MLNVALAVRGNGEWALPINVMELLHGVLHAVRIILPHILSFLKK